MNETTERLLTELHRYGLKTLAQLLEEQVKSRENLRALVYCPAPPRDSAGCDCRVGGSAGLGIDYESPRTRWVLANYRYRKQVAAE